MRFDSDVSACSGCSSLCFFAKIFSIPYCVYLSRSRSARVFRHPRRTVSYLPRHTIDETKSMCNAACSRRSRTLANSTVYEISALLNQCITSILGGAGHLLGLFTPPPSASSRDLVSALSQSGNLISSISHVLPQGTSISTVLSLLNLLSNINALNTDLQETLPNIINGAHSLLPPSA